jgi:hypothetical protein
LNRDRRDESEFIRIRKVHAGVLMKVHVIAILLALVIPPALTAGDLVITGASLQPASTLPALPVWVLIEVHNSGQRPVPLPNSYSLEATPEGGEMFVVETNPVGLVPDALPAEYQKGKPLDQVRPE